MTVELFLAIWSVCASAIAFWLAIQNKHLLNNVGKWLRRLERNKVDRSDEAIAQAEERALKVYHDL